MKCNVFLLFGFPAGYIHHAMQSYLSCIMVELSSPPCWTKDLFLQCQDQGLHTFKQSCSAVYCIPNCPGHALSPCWTKDLLLQCQDQGLAQQAYMPAVLAPSLQRSAPLKMMHCWLVVGASCTASSCKLLLHCPDW